MEAMTGGPAGYQPGKGGYMVTMESIGVLSGLGIMESQGTQRVLAVDADAIGAFVAEAIKRYAIHGG